MMHPFRFGYILFLTQLIGHHPDLVHAGPRKGPGVPVDGVRFVNSRHVQINFQRGRNSSAGNKASLYVTRDKGATWELSKAPASPTSPISYEAQDDGLYGFFIVLENDAGASSPPPAEGTAPQQWVRIDTQPPTLQLLGLRADPSFETNREIRLRWRTDDDNLMDRPVTLHYRTEESKVFIPIAESLAGVSEYRWRVPDDLRGRVEIKLAATDLAGKITEYKTDRLHLEGRNAFVHTPGARLEVATKSPPRILPAGYAEPDVHGKAASPQAQANARKCFEQGTYHRMRGEHDLASIRLEEAVKFDPDYLDAWHDLAGINLLQKRYAEAEKIFNMILAKDPQYRPAIKGLALVQAGQKNYKSSRKTLERLLLLAPDDAEIWLYYGDVVMFSGDRGEARDSWGEAAKMMSADADVRRRAEKRLEMYPGDSFDQVDYEP